MIYIENIDDDTFLELVYEWVRNEVEITLFRKMIINSLLHHSPKLSINQLLSLRRSFLNKAKQNVINQDNINDSHDEKELQHKNTALKNEVTDTSKTIYIPGTIGATAKYLTRSEYHSLKQTNKRMYLSSHTRDVIEQSNQSKDSLITHSTLKMIEN